MKQDRFLTGILVFIGMLAAAALTLFFLRQEGRDYGPEDSPEGIVYNYVLAVQKGDFERAYGYLAEGENIPDYDYFLQTIRYSQPEVALEITSSRVDGEEAWVEVVLHYVGSGPFETGWSSPDTARLVKQDGDWKLTYLPSPYWGWDWYQVTVEPVKP